MTTSTKDPTLLLTLKETAAELRVSVRTVYRLFDDGGLGFVLLGPTTRRVKREVLVAYIEANSFG